MGLGSMFQSRFHPPSGREHVSGKFHTSQKAKTRRWEHVSLAPLSTFTPEHVSPPPPLGGGWDCWPGSAERWKGQEGPSFLNGTAAGAGSSPGEHSAVTTGRWNETDPASAPAGEKTPAYGHHKVQMDSLIPLTVQGIGGSKVFTPGIGTGRASRKASSASSLRRARSPRPTEASHRCQDVARHLHDRSHALPPGSPRPPFPLGFGVHEYAVAYPPASPRTGHFMSRHDLTALHATGIKAANHIGAGQSVTNPVILTIINGFVEYARSPLHGPDPRPAPLR